ncbi:acetate kinase [Nonlabens dokdonensis]|uniref:Acetate kinase n=2 Tax=Nonlabens dokdonensis TaxID=328515 RepID=L7W589_NONDD|nr:acetate kinase [Nonlabens dokdonensis]AGC75264.1 acetate kinase [Nonlabens dokdonensis DSW-6]PZX38998.1 acetate kinase [Nonlabens dokdonensis]
MNILVLNAGSSSIKFQLLQLPQGKVVCSGMVERIGGKDAILSYKTDATEFKKETDVTTHKNGLTKIVSLLLDHDKGVITIVNEIHAVGHRVVHGGKLFTDTTLINEEVKEKIKEFSSLAPLHNPHNLEGILIAEELFPEAKQIAVFDTAFHQTMPVKVKKYALSNKFYDENDIQIYGFHGTSHKYVTAKALDHLKLESSKIISIHLGNGCSMTAVLNGKSVDTSLGFAPSNGLIMGSRSGDIDHAIIFHLVHKLGYEIEDVEKMLTKESGMLGLTGHVDLRDIQEKAANGDKNCQLALEMNAYRIKKYIGAYAAAMNGVDAIIFTAGIGENSALIRKMACSDMDFLGIQLDQDKNDERAGKIREIQNSDSKVKVLVIPTNEELEIASQVYDLVAH